MMIDIEDTAARLREFIAQATQRPRGGFQTQIAMGPRSVSAAPVTIRDRVARLSEAERVELARLIERLAPINISIPPRRHSLSHENANALPATIQQPRETGF